MGIFSKIISGLSKTNENLVREVRSALGQGELNEETLDALEEKLLAADIGFDITHTILDGLMKRAYGRKTSTDNILKWLAESTEELFLPSKPVTLTSKPHVILVIGVNGSGKTTTIGKLAHRYQQEGKSVILAAGDTFRAGAIEQLALWAERSNCPIVKHQEGSDPAAVIYDAYAAAKARGMDVLIADTAGRLQNKEHLMEELRKIVRVLRKHDESLPHEALLVIDGNTGQNAISQGKGFNQAIALSGLVVTKLDGTAKGGSLLSVSREFNVPVRWVGMGEGLDDLIAFDPKAYANGMFLGDKA